MANGAHVCPTAQREPNSCVAQRSAGPEGGREDAHGVWLVAMDESAREADARRRGRHAVITAYYVVVVLFVAIAAGNVIWQVWAPSFRDYPPVACSAALGDLARAVERAKDAAHSVTDDEEAAALARFREALDPEWSHHDAIAASCRRDPQLASLLDVIERLRYAEERAVRRESTELVPLRRKVSQFLAHHSSIDP
jgi:hypothetical protein